MVSTASTPHARQVDADFAEAVLKDLYSYRHKRRWVARLLWATLGLFGAHRFYLDRPGTGLLMAFSLGGGLIWWVVDGFLISTMVGKFNDEQEFRRRTGLPPHDLDFMPPLARDVLSQPPDWTHTWRAASRTRRLARFVADALVLGTLGVALGSVGRSADVWEGIFAVLVLVVVIAAGSTVERYAHIPVVRGLLLWSHRLRLFYYYSGPRSPLGLLFRPILGPILAPLRRRDRAEVRLYLQFGAVFTALFIMLDFGVEIMRPILALEGVPGLGSLLGLWLREATVTFVVIFGFATPVGAILNLYMLMMRTHTVPRLLCAVVGVAVLFGAIR